MTDKSECCNAEVKIADKTSYEEERELKEIFYFRCKKCKRLCHLRK